MTGAHVRDHAVADRLVESGGQAARALARERHDPQALQEPHIQAAGSDEGDEIAAGRPARRAQIETTAEALPITCEIDDIKVELALQVGARLGVSGRDQPGAVGGPVEPGDVPRAVRQLRNASANRRHYEEVVIPAIDETLAVVFVIKSTRNAGDRCTPDLLPAFRGPRVVHHRFWVGEHRADEGDPLAVGRPQRASDAFWEQGQLPRFTSGPEVDDEKLICGPDPADKSKMTTVRRPFRRMVSARAAGGLDRLSLEQPANDDAAAILSRIDISPAELVRDAFAVAAQPDVIDPTKAIEVFRANWGGHGVPRCYQQATCFR